MRVVRLGPDNLAKGGFVKVAQPFGLGQSLARINVSVAIDVKKALACAGVYAASNGHSKHAADNAVDMTNPQLRVVALKPAVKYPALEFCVILSRDRERHRYAIGIRFKDHVEPETVDSVGNKEIEEIVRSADVCLVYRRYHREFQPEFSSRHQVLHDPVVRPGSARGDSKGIVEFSGTVQADADLETSIEEELDPLWSEHCAVGLDDVLDLSAAHVSSLKCQGCSEEIDAGHERLATMPDELVAAAVVSLGIISDELLQESWRHPLNFRLVERIEPAVAALQVAGNPNRFDDGDDPHSALPPSITVVIVRV